MGSVRAAVARLLVAQRARRATIGLPQRQRRLESMAGAAGRVSKPIIEIVGMRVLWFCVRETRRKIRAGACFVAFDRVRRLGRL